MKVLISGRNSFIGKYLEPRLEAVGYTVYGLETAKGEYVDLRDKKAVEECVKRVQPDFVVHLAAKTEVALSFDNYAEVSEVNYVGTVILAEANRLFNSKLKLFLMASTMETYGHQEASDGPFTELTEQRPMAPYAVAKLACEKYLHYMQYAYSFPYVILRQTNAYGRVDNDFFVMERIITQMLWEDNCNLGNGDPIRNFIYIDDLIDLYMLLLEKYKDVRGETFVTGPDNGLTIKELVDLVAKQLNWSGEINWGTMPERPGEIYYLNSNADKAKKLLGWEAKISLEEGINRTIEIWKNQYIQHPSIANSAEHV